MTRLMNVLNVSSNPVLATLALTCAWAPVPAGAIADVPHPTVFGVALGQPMSIPTCPRRKLRDGSDAGVYEYEPDTVCSEPATELSGAPWKRGSVNFPRDKWPAISSASAINYMVVGSNVESVEMSTIPDSGAAGVIATISAKFGKPTSVRPEHVSVSGVSVATTVALWKRPDIIIEYRSIDPAYPQAGWARFDTPRMDALRSSKANALTPL